MPCSGEGKAGAALWGSGSGTSLPQRCLLNSLGGKCALVAFFLRGMESPALSFGFCGALKQRLGLEGLAPSTFLLVFLLSHFSLSFLGPGCIRRKQVGLLLVLLSLCLQLELGNVLIHANISGVSRGFSM